MNEWSKDMQDRYMAAMHRMQTGVAFMLEQDARCGSPKDLRVGINSAMLEHGALASLLIEKGIISSEEYGEAMCVAAEAEADRWEADVQKRLGSTKVTLM